MRLYWVVCAMLVFALVSCERCMKCHYTYTVTTIEQTLNGEQEVVTTYTAYYYDPVDSVYVKDECIKGDESFTIDATYQKVADTATLDNFDFVCTEL